jgi:threonine/homoserine/homoserine lactone efflux protein
MVGRAGALMMPIELSLYVAGFIYIVTPGPVFLAILCLVAEKGFKEGLKFISGAIIGCIFWFSFTYITLTKANLLPDIVFKFLTLMSSTYLFYLSYKMITKTLNNPNKILFKKPFYDGVIMSFLNPKSYPVMLAVFGSIILSKNFQGNQNFIELSFYSILGFWSGYIFMITVANFKFITIFFINNIRVFRIIFGFIFIYFATLLLINLLK